MPGVYAATPDVNHLQRWWAGHLVGGPESALGGRAALAASGLEIEAPVIEVWTLPGVRRLPRPGWRFRVDGQERLGRTIGSLPRIRLEDALLDLGESEDLDDWVSLLSDAARLGRVSLPFMVQRLEARGRTPAGPAMRSIIADFSGIESTLEWIYDRDVVRAHHLPAGDRQVSLSQGTRSDVLHREYGVIVEIDGRRHLRTVFRDLARDNTHASQGQTTLRYGSFDLREKPCEIAAQVAATLQSRGWTGELRRCRRCP
ncbi:MAG: DUF559 domain-containing protein [Propioniciclava sp.]